MSNRTVVIVPSRGRPENIKELLYALEDTQTTADFVLVLDNDDETIPEYVQVASNSTFKSINIFRFEREGRGMAKPLNKAAQLLKHNYDFFCFMGDDHRPRTSEWDLAMEDALTGAGGIAYGNDLIQGAGLPTAVVMSADIVRTLGGMTPPNMIHLYLDNFWLKLGQDLNRIHYLPEVIIEHLHPIAGKAEWDANYREVNAQEVYSADAVAFKDYIASADYQRLLETLCDQA